VTNLAVNFDPHLTFETHIKHLCKTSSFHLKNISKLSLFGSLGVLCFLAAVKHHHLTERVANYRENLFALEVLEDTLDWSFWLGVGSIVTHFAVCGVVAMSRIKLPKPEIKKPEEPTVSALDLLY
ncbi:hypothetical protein GOODEAATRI_011863, partial [Goodea atripinnis]